MAQLQALTGVSLQGNATYTAGSDQTTYTVNSAGSGFNDAQSLLQGGAGSTTEIRHQGTGQPGQSSRPGGYAIDPATGKLTAIPESPLVSNIAKVAETLHVPEEAVESRSDGAGSPETIDPQELSAEKPAETLQSGQPHAEPEPLGTDAGGTGGGETGVSRTGAADPGRALSIGKRTSVLVPGEDIEIPARYEVWRHADVIGSHSGLTFNPNPAFSADDGVENERDYTTPENQGRLLWQGSEEHFNGRYLITDNPDAVNGPSVVVRQTGKRLSSNGRGMVLDQVYARDGGAADSYRGLLNQEAAHYGVDPEDWAGERAPELVRVVDAADLASLPGGSKWAIRKTNVTGTAPLTASERALADAGQLTPEIKSEIGNLLEAAGPDATLNEALKGRAGMALVNRLIEAGFFHEQERSALQDERNGVITAQAKDRIAGALLGEFFHNSDQLQRYAPNLKQKLARMAAPLANVASDPDWDLMPAVREAVDLIEHAEAHDIKNLDDINAQNAMFEGSGPTLTPQGLTLAKLIRNSKPNDVVAAFRRYAKIHEEKDQEGFFQGQSTPEEAFTDAFGGPGAPLFGRHASRELSEPERKLAEQGWYSQLVKVIEEKMPAKVLPKQALAILTNPQNGVKADELKWTDMADWLQKQDRPLTKQEILDRALSNLLVVKEVHANRPGNPGRYEKYILRGQKKGYTELLFTLPAKPTPEYRAWSQFYDRMTAKYGDDWNHPRRAAPLTTEERAHFEQLSQDWDRVGQRTTREAYRSPHWSGIDNPVAHCRFDERTDAQGRRILFVEEIQSDWHQAGRDKGYRQGLQRPTPMPNFHDWATQRGATAAEIQRAWNNARGFAATDEPLYSEWQREWEERRAAERQVDADEHKVPTAPFAKTWHEMVFRRMLRYAAEHGFDAIAWTTGKQQAARYNLARHVAGVSWQPIRDEYLVDRYRRDHGAKYGADAQPGWLLTKSLLDAKIGTPEARAWQHAEPEPVMRAELADYLGKEVAQKLLAQPLEEFPHPGGSADLPLTDQRHSLVGKNLQIGGHGMSGFYDSILPSFAAKFGKKWGAKPELIQLASPVKSKEGEPAKRRLTSVHSLAINDAMRASVMQGQPLFARVPRLPAGQAPAFQRGQTTKWHLGRMALDAKPLALDPFLDRHAIAHGVNASAMEYIGRNIGLANDDAGSQVGGLHLGPLEAAQLLRNVAIDARLIGNPPALQTLAQILRGAIRANKSVVLVTDAPHISDDRRAAFLTEELNHVLQNLLGPVRQFLKTLAARIMALPQAQRALAGLEDKKTGPGYEFNKNDHLAALEICERLMRADRYSYQDLTLSKTERDSLGLEFVRALEQVYGSTQVKPVTDRIHAAIQQGAPHTGIPGRLARAGENSNLSAHEPARTGIGQTGRRTRDGGSSLFGPGDLERQNDLFSSHESAAVNEQSARDRDQLTGEQLTAQLNAPLTREEQLKKLKRSKDDPQSSLFEDNSNPQGSLFLGSGLGALQPYYEKHVAGKLAAGAKQAAEAMAAAKDDILKIAAPAARGESAQQASLTVRKNAAELQRSTDRAQKALEEAARYFDTLPVDERLDFMDKMEHGDEQETPELDQIADVMRQMLDSRREAIQALGTGKLNRFIENYFPHIWKKPELAQELSANYGKRPMEGAKGFLKKRSLETIADGIAAGLTPLSTNPVDLVLLKCREMDKYLMAHHILADLKQQGLLAYVDARDGKPPAGWQKIDDPVATVYGQSVQAIPEWLNEGLAQGLKQVIEALGIQHERGFLNIGDAVGRARQGTGNRIQTKHGTSEQVIFGSLDSDTYSYDPNTGRMKQYSFDVDNVLDIGTLTWNANGTLQQLAITDNNTVLNQITGNDTQTCTNLYDDLARLISNNCGSTWSQTFSFDAFGNIASSGSSSFQPTYNLATNQYATLPAGTPSYDANGNVLQDGFLPHSWDAEGRNISFAGYGGAIYDALARPVEQDFTTALVVLYAPSGKRLGTVAGSTPYAFDIPLPAGSFLDYNGEGTPNGLTYLHADWLGTTRLGSRISGPAEFAFAVSPFGQQYIGEGFYSFFTGVPQSASNNENETAWTFPARDLQYIQGRWLTPDPAGVAAVNPTDPQSWNRYAYARNNPLALVDPSGMDAFAPNPSEGDWGPCDDGWGDSGASPLGGCTFYPVAPPLPVGTGSGRGPASGGTTGPTSPGAGGSEGGSNAPSTPTAPASTGMPPGSFPDGENLGLPPGLRLPGLGQLWSSLLPNGGCDFGPCDVEAFEQSGNTLKITPQGSYWGYAGCLVFHALPTALITGATGVGLTAALGKSYPEPYPLPVGIVNKLPLRAATTGLKWGTKGSIVGAAIFAVTFEVQLNQGARGCAAVTGYTPWVFEP